ncbi:hypothetical protein [Planctomicrobium sp. SH527]|uniref:hypothetical protein n=1 Tax=Planctomicrobium sp. SH527 TaxID=3448123 RepID=UPI003F5CB3B2
MTLYRRLIRTTRPLMLASIAGSAVCSLSGSVVAQQSMYPASGANVAPGYAPGMFPVDAPLALQPIPVNTTAQHSGAGANANQTMPILSRSASQDHSKPIQANRGEYQTVQYQSDVQQTESSGILNRFGRVFRGRTTAPVDPGMNYPKASQYPSPPQAPGVTGSTPGQIPGIPSAPPATMQPGLFQPSPSVNPIVDHVPPAPDGGVGMSQQVRVAPPPAPGVQLPPLQNLPELKMIMQGEQKTVQAPPPPQDSYQAPVVSPLVPPAPLSASNSMPSLEIKPQALPPVQGIAPGEPMGGAQAQKPVANILPPAPEGGAAPATPPVATAAVPKATAPKSADPFADLFPADKSTMAKPTEPAVAAQGVDKPYTGLTLDADVAILPAKVPDAMPATPDAAPQVATQTPAPATPPVQVAMVDSPQVQLQNVPTLKLLPVAPPEVTAAKPADQPTLPLEEPKEMKVPALELPSEESLPKLSMAPPVPDAPAVKSNAAELPPAPNEEKPAQQSDPKSKFERIAARKNMAGLKGFCPVVLRDQRDLVDSKAEFEVVYNDYTYSFSSKEAMEKFEAEPAKYAPVNSCGDVIHEALAGEALEGSLDYAVWFKGRLYLFSSVETMETFVAAPSSHAMNE